MFELAQLILSSQIGAYIFSGLQDALYAVIVISDCEDCGFNDLGQILFGGVLAAILVGVVLSLVLRNYRDRNAAGSRVVSITSPDK